MSSKYFRWKIPLTQKGKIEWEEMNAADFFTFLNSDESCGRYFIKLDNDICPDADIVFIEAPQNDYEKWYRENRHNRYLRFFDKRTEKLSLDCPLDGEDGSFHDIVADMDVDIETEACQRVMNELLHTAISRLNKKRREAVIVKYFIYPKLSDKEIAKLLDVSYEAFHDLRFRGLNDIRKFLKTIPTFSKKSGQCEVRGQISPMGFRDSVFSGSSKPRFLEN